MSFALGEVKEMRDNIGRETTIGMHKYLKMDDEKLIFFHFYP